MFGVAGTVRSTTWGKKQVVSKYERNQDRFCFLPTKETVHRNRERFGAVATQPQLSVVSAKQGIVEMPGMVASGDNWAEHGFPWVKLGLGKSWWPHSVHNTRSSVI